MQTIETTYMVQLETGEGWLYYSTHQYETRGEAESLAGEIYGGTVTTRIVTVTKTVETEPMTVVIDTDEGPTRWAL